MKKLFVKESYKKRSIKKSKDEIKKRQKHNKKNQKKPNAQYKKVAKYKIADKLRSKSQKITIKMPNIFSITDNTDENLKVFNDIYNHIESGHKLFLNMAEIEVVTPDALLYILSIFEYFKITKVPTNIKGNLPLNNEVKDFIIQSHFFDYVKSDVVVPPIQDEHVLHIEKGMKVDGRIVKGVIQFAIRHLRQNLSSKSRAMYKIMIEMMGNTVEHAYRTANESSKWYLMARHDINSGKVNFAFLDGGFGVPTTIRKNFPDRLLELFSKILPASDDSRLLLSALDGNFRTKTGKKYRGKGLPNIYMSYKKHRFIDNLKIISNFGYVDQGSKCSIKCKFHGTLYTWEFI